jgi:serine/threonine protein kinase
MTGRTVSHYRILDKLGEGGMGVVYKARDTHLDRFVAIQVLPAERVSDPARKWQFVQGAKAASARGAIGGDDRNQAERRPPRDDGLAVESGAVDVVRWVSSGCGSSEFVHAGNRSIVGHALVVSRWGRR